MKTQQGYLEKRVFLFFFVITFVMIFFLTLVSWQIIRFSILQNERKEIEQIFSQINNQIIRFTELRRERLRELKANPGLADALQSADRAKITSFFRTSGYSDMYRRIYIYDAEQELAWGEKYPVVDQHIDRILNIDSFNRSVYYPILIGKDIYILFWDKISIAADEEDERETLLGYICYLEQIDITGFSFPPDTKPIVTTNIGIIDTEELSEQYRQVLPSLLRGIDKIVENRLDRKIIRFNIESSGGLLVLYDAFNHPALYVFFTYDRDLNQFAYKGLLVFVLILTGLALLMISLAGTWFKGKIIAPVKDVSLKMKEIESDPTIIEPMEKKYGGTLGDMIDTFNSMNSALARYSHSLMVYKTITDNLDSGILWMDGDLNIILCNPFIAKIFEMDSCDAVVGKSLNDLIDLGAETSDRAKSQGIFIPHFEIKTGTSKKFVKFVIFSIKKVTDSSGLRHIAGIYDITKETKEADAREMMEFELIKSNRLAELGRLAEGVVHNINSPLNTIVGYAQLLKRDYKDNLDLDKILAASNNISVMVKKLLSKVKEDSISMIRPLDINELLDLELDMCKHNIFFSQNVKLIRDFQPLSGKVYAAHGDISICIANIINNAIQAMKSRRKKELRVATKEEDGKIAITITDTGTGISSEHISRIFDPDYSTKESADGTGYGLGLAISKSIIEKYQGSLKVESTIGTGSIFTVYLPTI